MTSGAAEAAVQIWTSPLWIKLLTFASALLCGGVAGMLLRIEGDSPWLWPCLLLAAISVLGTADALRSRVAIDGTQLEVTRNLQRRIYPREAFAEVHVEKGVPVTLTLRAGGVLRLPEVGPSPAAVARALRRWLGQV